MPTFSSDRPTTAPWRRAVAALVRQPALGPAMAQAAVLAPAVEASLRVLGFHRTLRWVDGLPVAQRPFSRLSVTDAERPVRWAFRCQPWLRALCLERSLVQLAMHRRAGTGARLVIGVRLPGDEPSLDAHAWVETLDDEPHGGRGVGSGVRFADLDVDRTTEAA